MSLLHWFAMLYPPLRCMTCCPATAFPRCWNTWRLLLLFKKQNKTRCVIYILDADVINPCHVKISECPKHTVYVTCELSSFLSKNVACMHGLFCNCVCLLSNSVTRHSRGWWIWSDEPVAALPLLTEAKELRAASRRSTSQISLERHVFEDDESCVHSNKPV